MSVMMSEAELRAHCERAGKTCKTEMGCTCTAGKFVGIGDYVQGPSAWGALDNLDNEQEQSMRPPGWLAMLLLVGLGFVLSEVASMIWRAKP